MTHRPETLAARFGDMALPDVLIALTACERRGRNGLARRDLRGLVNPALYRVARPRRDPRYSARLIVRGAERMLVQCMVSKLGAPPSPAGLFLTKKEGAEEDLCDLITQLS